MTFVFSAVDAAFQKLGDFCASLGGLVKPLAIIIAFAVAFHIVGLTGLLIIAMILASRMFPAKLRLGLLGAAIGLLFGWAGLAIGLGLGLANGVIVELGLNDPLDKVAASAGQLDGLVLAGLYIMASGGGSFGSVILIALFYLLGGFVAQTLVGFFGFIRDLGREEPRSKIAR